MMIEYGRSARWYNNYGDEIGFCKKYGFDFMQIWYKNGGLEFDKLPNPKEKAILEADFPVIIHAVFEIGDYEKYDKDLLRVLKFLGHSEVIIHPVCKPSLVSQESIYKLSECNKKITEMFSDEEITVYIENNCKLVPLNYTPEELRIIFGSSPKTELLLDIAHIDHYGHLQELINVKFPKCLHIADKHLTDIHEHLPIGHGELDYKIIFSDYLKDFDGKIIFEVVTDHDDEIINSKTAIQEMIDG